MTALKTIEDGPFTSLHVNGPGGRVTFSQAKGGKICIRVDGRGSAKAAEMTMCRTSWQSLRDALWRLDYSPSGETLTVATETTIPSQEGTDHE
ncbi:hypothetical protein [Trichloromonas sp.]|uniref:hypothetical protein n=1 Tax=Trichloromonas sp. TaxID=3069249 RepID=UPI002A417190|nr:hypothetical protein [Trichloromonas sp.]